MPRYGFNLQWLFQRDRGVGDPDVRVLDAIAAWGFDFVRLPMDYRTWAVGGDPRRADEQVLGAIDAALEARRARDLHLCLALHRAPGYSIIGWESEPYDLWSDVRVQDDFVLTWERFASRYAAESPEVLSFDLVNEPPELGLRGFTRDAHEAVVRRTVAAIRVVSPHRPLVLDGLDGGNLAMPELADLGTTQSVRGYQPMRVSHSGAPWWPPAALLEPPAGATVTHGSKQTRHGMAGDGPVARSATGVRAHRRRRDVDPPVCRGRADTGGGADGGMAAR